MASTTACAVVEDAYARHAHVILARLVTTTRDPAAAEDLMQEAFVRLLEEVEAGRQPDNVGGWLWSVARNLATSRGRRLAVADRRIGELAQPDGIRSPEAIVVEAEAQRAVVDALATLGSAERAATIMAAYGIPGGEIARAIGRTQGATRTALCRARAKVRAAVAEGSAA